MACSNIILKGMGAGCKDNLGGIRKAFIIKEDDLTGVQKDSGNTVTGFTYASTGVTFMKYHFRKNTSDYQCTINSDDALGTFAVENNINLQFSNISKEKNEEIEALGKENLVVVVLDNKGKYWLFGGGIDLPVTCNAGTLNSGKATTDGQLYNITLNNSTDHFPYEVDKEAIEPTPAPEVEE